MTRLRLATLLMLAVSVSIGAVDSAYNRGVEAYQAKKYDEAFRHWTEAASHGSVDALNNLGYLLFSGRGVTKNQEEATDLWRTAAYAGHSEAKWHLGAAYEHGTGVNKDRARAYAWYRCAVASSQWKLKQADSETERHIMKDTDESLRKLTAELSKQDLARGEVLAAECIQRYGKPAL